MKSIRYTLPHVATRFHRVGPKLPNQTEPQPPVKLTKIGDGRNPHASKAVDTSGSVEGWQHGHYDYAGNKHKGGL